VASQGPERLVFPDFPDDGFPHGGLDEAPAAMTWRALGREKNMAQKVTKMLRPDRINTVEKPRPRPRKPPAAGPRLMRDVEGPMVYQP